MCVRLVADIDTFTQRPDAQTCSIMMLFTPKFTVNVAYNDVLTLYSADNRTMSPSELIIVL